MTATTAATGQQVFPTSTHADEGHDFPRVLAITLAVLAALTFVVATLQLIGDSQVTPGSGSSATTGGFGASRPGGSIYDQQVPRAAADQWVASRPGGSIYSQQVPRAAAARDVALRPGGSVYDQQVPSAAR